MKNKYFGLSTMGYVIAVFIMLGVVMIFSAPMLFDNLQKDDKKTDITNVEQNDLGLKLDQISNEFDKRLNALEQNLQNQDSVFDKYVCTIEGTLNSEGEVVPINNNSEKFVFVCEYKK